MMRRIWLFKTPLSADRAQPQEARPFNPEARPDFLCVGAQKAGTGWLYRQLSLHPDFWMPPLKELHYLNELSRIQTTATPRAQDERDRRFMAALKELSARPYIDLENYAQLFEPKGALLSGDVTPAYSMLRDEIVERVAAHFPQLKVIFMARDPVSRAWSQLSMAVRKQMIRPFDVNDADEVIRNLLHPEVLLRSHPSQIVARWRRYIPPERFGLYFFDDLETDPAELRRAVIRFLGADPQKPSGRLRPEHNTKAGQEKLKLSDTVRSRIARFFERELKACAAELGGAAKKWPARYGILSALWFMQLACDCDDLLWDLFVCC